jgi:hypothetical protein
MLILIRYKMMGIYRDKDDDTATVAVVFEA